MILYFVQTKGIPVWATILSTKVIMQ